MRHLWSSFKASNTPHMKCLHHSPSVYPHQLCPSEPFHPATQPGLVFTWDCFRDFMDWFWFRHFVDWFCSLTQPHKSFFSCSLGEKAADCKQQWGKLAMLAENRLNTVPWFVQFWGIFLWFGRKTRQQRGRTMAKFTPTNQLQLLSGVVDKRKFWMSRTSKRKLWTGGF